MARPEMSLEVLTVDRISLGTLLVGNCARASSEMIISLYKGLFFFNHRRAFRMSSLLTWNILGSSFILIPLGVMKVISITAVRTFACGGNTFADTKPAI